MTRINKALAQKLGIGRRQADKLVQGGTITINGIAAEQGQDISDADIIAVDGKELAATRAKAAVMVMLNKPVGVVCSRTKQGTSKTVYDLLPEELRHLHTIGRLDKDSSGLLLLTDDGDLTYTLTHPKFEKRKIYRVRLHAALTVNDVIDIEGGIELEDGLSRLQLKQLSLNRREWQVTMHEGRNRQIRRTFAKAGYKVESLHRTVFGGYKLGKLKFGEFTFIEIS